MREKRKIALQKEMERFFREDFLRQKVLLESAQVKVRCPDCHEDITNTINSSNLYAPSFFCTTCSRRILLI